MMSIVVCRLIERVNWPPRAATSLAAWALVMVASRPVKATTSPEIKGTFMFYIDVEATLDYTLAHATQRTSIRRRPLLPCHQSRQRPAARLPQGRRLRGFSQGHEPRLRRNPDAGAGLLPLTQPLSPGRPAHR